MDERKKVIKDLEIKKSEDQKSLNLMLEDFGESLIKRLVDENLQAEAGAARTEYLEIQRELEESQTRIRQIETDSSRIKAVEDELLGIAQEQGTGNKELVDLYTRLGESLAEDPAFSAFAAPYRSQLDNLIPKIESLEETLGVLDEKNNGNFFNWVGNNAKSMVLRTSLKNSQTSLRKLYTSMGERFSHLTHEETITNSGVLSILGETEKIRTSLTDLETRSAVLKEERRRIGESFGSESNPAKIIDGLEKNREQKKKNLQAVYLRFGDYVSAGERKKEFSKYFDNEDKLLLTRIHDLRDAVADTQNRIVKLEAAIKIDEEKAEILKLEKATEEQRMRISAAEKTISEFSIKIEDIKKKIAELQEIAGTDS
ncbi:hypothetical protein [Breznakiella homolactica]|uniref:Uncharacterized protein n=1 Tax=Breznakiella homolactica TaxID=2798577 RepID=A0A7T8B9C2_9SPIR|nr:hypothetical protein [Breznakiella homolactica]QQO08312.1 hypothetical protein JFL75_15440 [Breznakiella homolactica]